MTTSSGTGSIVNDGVSLVAGATVTTQISSSATSNLINVARVTPPAGVTDSNAANNTASVSLTSKPIAPKFLREQRISKGTSKKALFKLFFNGPLNAGIARSTAHYRAALRSGKTLKVKSASYSNQSVTITVVGFSTRKPASVTITGLVGANGAPIGRIVTRL